MKTSTITNDNVTEILNKIVDFTDRRNTVITDNILNVNSDNYTPRDLDAKGFAELMASALSEHLINDRLLERKENHSIHRYRISASLRNI